MSRTTFDVSHNTQSDPPRRRSNPLMWVLIAAAGVVVLIGVLTWTVFIPQSVLSDGNQRQADLTGAYSNAANYLSDCVVKTSQTANVAEANAAAFTEAIEAAISGEGDNPAAHVDTTTAAGRSALLPILVQAYPDLSGQTELFNRVVNTINGCRTEFRDQQTLVLDKAVQLQSWLTGSWKVRTFGDDLPNENLSINIPGVDRLTGQDALDKMQQPIVESTTSQSYQTGVLENEDPFAND